MSDIEGTVSLTFIGHATWLIEGNGLRILTDPVLGWSIAGIYPRLTPPALSLAELPHTDVVLISHPHYDHLDVPTLRQLDQNCKLVVPRGLEDFTSKFGFREIIPLRTWDRINITDKLKITAVPVRHALMRGIGPGATVRGAVSYVLELADHRIYFAGDTAYHKHFASIREKTRPDIALLPIGAYRPWFIMRHFHLNPRLAIQAFLDLQADWCLPYHWGTFVLSLESLAEPIELFKQEALKKGLAEKIICAQHGDTVIIDHTHFNVQSAFHQKT
ncbi:MBL fold metallo-hydrolase [candidate division CSSED10-310 bacterium]|uniref:MBL fold metallo-hydrolase n=1 Tax=candidate division CSSED10-310 bacterium TaxID=2855610 RepID=A0ABV6YT72_UNCC1